MWLSCSQEGGHIFRHIGQDDHALWATVYMVALKRIWASGSKTTRMFGLSFVRTLDKLVITLVVMDLETLLRPLSPPPPLPRASVCQRSRPATVQIVRARYDFRV